MSFTQPSLEHAPEHHEGMRKPELTEEERELLCEVLPDLARAADTKVTQINRDIGEGNAPNTSNARDESWKQEKRLRLFQSIERKLRGDSGHDSSMLR